MCYFSALCNVSANLCDRVYGKHKKTIGGNFYEIKEKDFYDNYGCFAFFSTRCVRSNGDDSKSTGSMDKNMDGMDHSTMDMSGSKEVPKGLQEAKKP